MTFDELRRIYNPEREALCVDKNANILACHSIGFLCSRPVTDYGAATVTSHTDRGNDILVELEEATR